MCESICLIKISTILAFFTNISSYQFCDKTTCSQLSWRTFERQQNRRQYSYPQILRVHFVLQLNSMLLEKGELHIINQMHPLGLYFLFIRLQNIVAVLVLICTLQEVLVNSFILTKTDQQTVRKVFDLTVFYKVS